MSIVSSNLTIVHRHVLGQARLRLQLFEPEHQKAIRAPYYARQQSPTFRQDRWQHEAPPTGLADRGRYPRPSEGVAEPHLPHSRIASDKRLLAGDEGRLQTASPAFDRAQQTPYQTFGLLHHEDLRANGYRQPDPSEMPHGVRLQYVAQRQYLTSIRRGPLDGHLEIKLNLNRSDPRPPIAQVIFPGQVGALPLRPV
jgi:hypothetical protein